MLVFSAGTPMSVGFALDRWEIELGRADARLGGLDPRMSRRHARVTFDSQKFLAMDLGSHNGSAIDGEAAPPNQPRPVQHLLRTGESLFLVSRDIRAIQRDGVQVSPGRVLGPAMQALLRDVENAGRFGSSLHIMGESGTGKESLAQTFHRSGRFQNGRLVPVNCAAIPQGLAERLLFGVRRGAYSDAIEDASGYIEAAAGGTLFLDEISELDLSVQAKLLRVLESKEVLPLGGTRPRSVDFQLCSASNKDLRAQVARGHFREDLYFRVSRPQVTLPPLRQRAEEMPWLIESAIKPVTDLPPHVSFVEACLLRPWPGNVRELLLETRIAAQTALTRGCPRIELSHLSSSAGMVFAETRATAVPPPLALQPSQEALDERLRLHEALRQHRGNISAAARALGIHRNQMRRLLDRHQLDPQRYA